ncbi:MAG: hypothetical protein KDA75_12850 [Planctomycetaceae bacterium]|nr:hypothetical protein [Planctomycetaceae bacterium]
MKLQVPTQFLPEISRSTAVGYVLSALGLLSGGFGVVRWLAAFAGLPLSATTLAISLTIGLLLSGAGFTLLVAGSDPFAEETWIRPEPSLSFIADDNDADEWSTPADPTRPSESDRTLESDRPEA